MIVKEYSDGIVICGDSTSSDVISYVKDRNLELNLAICDPPYGNIVTQVWDQVEQTDDKFAAWMCDWTRSWSQLLSPGAAFYVWGGIGIPGFRPFFKYLTSIEEVDKFELANLITWGKKRAYGLSHNYLFTREECAYFVKGNKKKPRCFNVPLLDEKRGYAGFNKKYPAKSEFKRRTNVWTDITEIFQGKIHPTQKAQRLYEVMIEIHTVPGEYVIDMFAGAGTCALACRKLGRKFVLIESDHESVAKIEKLLNEECKNEHKKSTI